MSWDKEKHDAAFRCWAAEHVQQFIVDNIECVSFMKDDEDFIKMLDLCDIINTSTLELKNLLEKKGLKIEINE